MEPKKKPSRFFMEQWHLARAQSPPGSPPSSSDTLRQVVSRLEGMVCGPTNTLHLHLGLSRSCIVSLNYRSCETYDLISPETCVKYQQTHLQPVNCSMRPLWLACGWVISLCDSIWADIKIYSAGGVLELNYNSHSDFTKGLPGSCFGLEEQLGNKQSHLV